MTTNTVSAFLSPISLSASVLVPAPVLSRGQALNARRARYRTRSRVVPQARAPAGASSTSTIATFDELVTSLWRKVSGGRKEPINTPVESFQPRKGEWSYLLSTTIVAKAGREDEMARTLSSLDGEPGVLLRAVNQNPEDRACFLVLEHFSGTEAMKKYQSTDKYQAFIRRVQPLLEKPMGVHLCKEKDGQLSHGYYPFGPGGEGGRDDMIWR